MRIFILVFFPVLLFSCSDSNNKNIVPGHPFVPEKLKYILLVHSKDIPRKYIDSTQRHLHKAFGLGIRLIESPALPKNLVSDVHKDRYRADSILQYMRSTYSDQGLKVIMLTHHDISTTKYSNFKERKIKLPKHRYKDWAIFGLGSCPGRCCVVSVKRLWARKADEKTFLNRVKNISVHEIGHTFGLPHCPRPKCVMNDANETILTVDRSTGLFCEDCKTKLGF